MTSIYKSRWFLPLCSVALGVAFFVAFWVGGQEGSAWFALALMTVVGVAFLLGGRFDMVRGPQRRRPRRVLGAHRRACDRPRRPRRDRHDHRHVPVGVGARPGRLAVRRARRDRGPRLHRRARGAANQELSSVATSVARLARRQQLAPRALRRVLVVAEADELRPVAEAVRLHLVVAHLDDELGADRRLLELAATPAVWLREAAVGRIPEQRDERASRSRRASPARPPPSRRSRSRRRRRRGRAASSRSDPDATSSGAPTTTQSAVFSGFTLTTPSREPGRYGEVDALRDHAVEPDGLEAVEPIESLVAVAARR